MRPRLIVSLAVALLALLLWARTARAAPAAQLPDPCAAPGDCLLPALYASPRLQLLAAENARVYAAAVAPAALTPRLVVLDAGRGLAERGGLDLDARSAAPLGDLLYALDGDATLATLGVANPDHPLLLDRLTLEGPATALLARPGALYALAPRALSTTTQTTDLVVFSLANPEQPRPYARITSHDLRRVALEGERLAAVGLETLALFSLADPLAPTLTATVTVRTLFAAAVAPPFDLALAGSTLYLMAQGPEGAPRCRILDLTTPSAPQPGAECPFIPLRTTIANGFAYVNPNPSASEYLDYRVYSLATPAAPVLTATLPQRFAKLVASGGALYAQDSQQRITHYTQTATGALETRAATWTPATLDAEGDVALVAAGRLYVEGGPSDDGERLVILDGARPGAPQPLGALVSPALDADRLLAHGSLLLSRRANRITLIDVAIPAQPRTLGHLDALTGEAIELFTVGGDGRLYVATEQNLLLSVEITQPLTPTLRAALDIPGAPRHLLWVRGMLYVYEEGALSIVDARHARLDLVKRIDIGEAIEEATAYGPALYLRAAGLPVVQIVDATHPTTPQPLPLAPPSPGAELVRLLPVSGGRLPLIYRIEPEEGADLPESAAQSASYTLAVYDLADPLHPRLVAVLPGLDSPEVTSDGATVALARLHVINIGDRRARLAALPPAADFVFAAPDAITYTVPSLAQSGACIRHTQSAPHSIPLQPPQAWYSGLYRVEVVPCADNAPLTLPAPLQLRVTLPADRRPAWRDPLLALDGGDRWRPLAFVHDPPTRTLEASLDAPATWAILGPPWPAVHLPIITTTAVHR